MTLILDKIRRNWGWVVTTSAATLFIVVHGFLYSFGLLMVELREEFDSDVTVTGYVGTAAYGMMWIFCIFATPIVHRIGFRPAAILGVVTCSASSLITSFMPGVLPLFGSYSILYAGGSSLMTSAAFLLILKYFPVRHTTSALGVATAGVNTGILVFNPLMYAMISRWGWRNALRIVCAIILGIGLPCTSVFIPPSSSLESKDDIDENKTRLKSSLAESEAKLSNGEKVAPPKDNGVKQPCLPVENGTICKGLHHQVSLTTGNNVTTNYKVLGDGDGEEALDLMEQGKGGVGGGGEGGGGEEEEDMRRSLRCGGWCKLLSYPDAWLLGMGALLGSVGLAFLYFSTVSFIVLAGFSKWTASLMMAIMGLTEIVGKIIVGVVADRIPVPKLFYMVASNCLGACMLYATLHAKTETAMYAIVAVEGCFVMAPLDSLAHSVANQLYEPSLKSLLWSYIMLACGVGGILAAVFGESVDKTGSYDTALYCVTGVFFAAALFLVLVPVYQRAFSKDRYILFKNAKSLLKKKKAAQIDDKGPVPVYELLPQMSQTDEKV